MVYGHKCVTYTLAGAMAMLVDNDAAKHALVRGTSSIAAATTTICEVVCADEIEQRSLSHWERAPGSINMADPPSRGHRPARD